MGKKTPSWVKNTLLFLNFIYLVAGITCVVLGLMVFLDKPLLNSLLNLDTGGTTVGMITGGAVIIIIVGVVTMVFSILGCCGASKESKVLLGVYIGLLILLLLIQLVAGALGAAYRTQTEDGLRQWMIGQLAANYDGRGDTNLEFSKALDFAQVEFDCCGINNYSDFKELALNWTERDSRTIPIACCKVNKTQFYNRNIFLVNNRSCTTLPTLETSNIATPCFDKILDHLMTQALYIILIAFILILLEFLGVVFACCLMRTVEDTTLV